MFEYIIHRNRDAVWGSVLLEGHVIVPEHKVCPAWIGDEEALADLKRGFANRLFNLLREVDGYRG